MNYREIAISFRRSLTWRASIGTPHSVPFTQAHRIGAILAIAVRTAIVLGGIVTAAAFLP